MGPFGIPGWGFVPIGFVMTLIALNSRKRIKLEQNNWPDEYSEDAMERNTLLLIGGILLLLMGLGNVILGLFGFGYK